MSSLRESIVLFEIDVPRCSRTYGIAPCTAVLGTTGTAKCFNSRKTCQDPANLLLSETVTLRFARPQDGILQYGPVLPAIAADPSTRALAVNLAGMERSLSALGRREEVTVKMQDFQHSDLQLDKYRLERMTGAAAEKHLSLPGESGDYASTPDSAAASIVGDLSMRAKATPNDWTPAAAAVLEAKWGAAGQRSYKLEVIATGQLRLSWSTDGTAVLARDSTVAVGASDGTIKHVLATLDVDNGAAGHDVKFYTSDSGATWAQLGATVTTAGITSIFDSTAALSVGAEADGASGLWAGKLHYADVRAIATTAGTPAAKFDPQGAADRATSFVSGTGETWTVQQSGTPKAELVAEPAPYDPFERGTFAGKFLARHPYYTSFNCRAREGYIGDALADMRVRNYVVASITGPADGTWTVKAQDLFSLIERRKSVAPPASTATLSAGITASATAATLTPAGIGDSEFGPLETAMGTPGSGYATIGDEICAYTRVADALTLTRAQETTVASSHDADDTVQWNLVITPRAPQAIIKLLLENFSKLPASSIDITAWNAAVPGTVGLFSRHIAKPEPVAELLGQVCELAGLTLWPDVSTSMIELRALRAAPLVATIDDAGWILDGSLSLQREEQKRVSRVVVHYAQRNPLESLAEQKNYGTHLVLPTDGATLYGTESVRDVWAPWIPAAGRALAEACGKRITAMFKNPPIAATVATNSEKASVFAISDYADLKVDELQGFDGSQGKASVAIVSMKRNEEETTLELQQVVFADDDGVRRIYIDTDMLDVNLRTLHDSLFAAPIGTEVVEATLSAGIYTGSTSTATAGLRTGDWPAGVSLTAVINGEAVGKGGRGGTGGTGSVAKSVDGGVTPGATSATAGSTGLAGGPAFEATYAVTLKGSGAIRAGGSGAGGGGGTGAWRSDATLGAVGGTGGSGGRGFNGGEGGAGGSASGDFYVDGGESSVQQGYTGAAGARTGAGSASAGRGAPIPPRIFGSSGGTGGDWASVGGAGSSDGHTDNDLGWTKTVGAGGAGGAAGPAVVGNAFITWDASNTITVNGALT